MPFGHELRALRVKYNLSLRDFAAAL